MDAINDVRVELYRSFIEECRAPSVQEIANRLSISGDEVVSSLRSLDDQDVIALRPDSDDVWLVHPFCASEGPYTTVSGERRWDAICIWDALGILALTGSSGTVEGDCPDCGERLEVTVQGGAVSSPDGYLVHFGVPARKWYDDIAFT